MFDTEGLNLCQDNIVSAAIKKVILLCTLIHANEGHFDIFAYFANIHSLFVLPSGHREE